jgi:hypothetical protein
LHVRGAIFLHRQLVFHNGVIGKKYLVLLNTPSENEPYLFVKTTSQQKNRPTTPGCIRKWSLFFVPAGKTFFPEDTWIQLHELYPIPPEDIDTNKDIRLVSSLDAKTIEAIVNCLFESEEDNIAPIFKKLLRPPLKDSLIKLKEKFTKNR